jgi:hypothetical protein
MRCCVRDVCGSIPRIAVGISVLHKNGRGEHLNLLSRETVKYSFESRGTRNQERLCWRGPAAICRTNWNFCMWMLTVKEPECESDHSPFSAEVTNAWRFSSLLQYVFLALCVDARPAWQQRRVNRHSRGDVFYTHAGPAIYVKDRPVLSSERAPHKNKTVTVTQVIKIWSQAPNGCFIPRETGRLTVGRNIKLNSTQYFCYWK